MKQDIKVPTMGESVTEAIIAQWLVDDGGYVNRNDPLVVLESDKANFEVPAEVAGQLSRGVDEGETVTVGAVIGSIDTSVEAPAGESSAPAASTSESATTEQPAAAQEPTLPQGGGASQASGHLGPAARRVATEKGINPATIQGTGPGGRVTKADAMAATPTSSTPSASSASSGSQSDMPELPHVGVAQRGTRREKMSMLRKRIAQRLVEAQQTAAILTTFNEIDMTALLALRSSYKDDFKEKFGVSLGFMGLFTKAVCEALKFVPAVGAFIDGDDVIYHDAANIGIAVGTPRGLVVPVIRDADLMSISQIEQAIRHYALKARDGKISIDDLQGGNFTISNGGVYGSLMSTPILNPPQSGILGMHKIQERPMVVDGEIKVRPMMYVALSYDHRIIDGQEAVTFLVKVKDFIEDPSRLVIGI